MLVIPAIDRTSCPMPVKWVLESQSSDLGTWLTATAESQVAKPEDWDSSSVQI